MSVSHEIQPNGIAPPAANYAHATLTEGATRWLHTSGVVPTSLDGTSPAGIVEQAALVWANIAALLAAANMVPSNVVSVTTYVVAGIEFEPVMEARDAFLGGHRAASTLITVPGLARPQWLMEISIIAAA